MSATRKLLFVCTGNICRSPMAQFMAAARAREAGLPLSAASAGVEGVVGSGMTGGAVRALAARGIKGVKHSARQLDERMLAEADAVYALTRGHRDVMVSRFPAHAGKISVLREAAGLPVPDVEDPYGLPDADYLECAEAIDEALKILVRRNTHAEKSR